MRRLKCEKETIILTNEDDGFYDVYTFNQSLQKRLRSFAEKCPDDCWLKGASEDGSETYMISHAEDAAVHGLFRKDLFIKQQNELLKNRKNNQRIHRMRFKRKKPHDHEEK